MNAKNGETENGTITQMFEYTVMCVDQGKAISVFFLRDCLVISD